MPGFDGKGKDKNESNKNSTENRFCNNKKSSSDSSNNVKENKASASFINDVSNKNSKFETPVRRKPRTSVGETLAHGSQLSSNRFVI